LLLTGKPMTGTKTIPHVKPVYQTGRDYRDLVIQDLSDENVALREHVASLVHDVDIYTRIANQTMTALQAETAHSRRLCRARDELREEIALLRDDLARLREDILRGAA